MVGKQKSRHLNPIAFPRRSWGLGTCSRRIPYIFVRYMFTNISFYPNRKKKKCECGGLYIMWRQYIGTYTSAETGTLTELAEWPQRVDRRLVALLGASTSYSRVRQHLGWWCCGGVPRGRTWQNRTASFIAEVLLRISLWLKIRPDTSAFWLLLCQFSDRP